MKSKLDGTFYLRDDVVQISRDLLGKFLCTRSHCVESSIMITETEAYAGVNDRASHAYGDRRTKRTEPMYADGGIAYVYLCYGIHHLFNVVTNFEGVPHAVLIRSGKPVEGAEHMLERRQKVKVDRSLLGGPGRLSQALGITTADTGTSLNGDRIWLEDRGIQVEDNQVIAGPRIGVDYAEEDANRPYRFIAQVSEDRFSP